MSPLVFTPSSSFSSAPGELILSDGLSDLDLMGSPPWGLYLVELVIPVPPRANAYVPNSEGQSRIRSKPENPTGSMRLRVDRAGPIFPSEALFAADVDELQAMVESAHKRKGEIRFTPPNLEQVFYDIESIQFTEAPADGPAMSQLRQEFVVEFEVKPYGRKAAFAAFTDEAFAGPIDGIEIGIFDGHVDALAVLTLEDNSSVNSDFVEFGLVQDGYNAAADIRIINNELATGDFAGTQASPGDPVVTTLDTDVLACCGTGTQVHGGKQKISVIYQTDGDDVWMRFVWRINGGEYSFGRWVYATPGSSEHEATMAVIPFGDDVTDWDGWVEAYDGDGTNDLAIEEIQVMPAQVNGRARRTPRDLALPKTDTEHVLHDGQSMRFSSYGAISHSGARDSWIPLDGDVLKIPASAPSGLTTFLVVRRRTNDIDDDRVSAGRTASLLGTLEITPRVVLM